jgi:hypothetical protein
MGWSGNHLHCFKVSEHTYSDEPLEYQDTVDDGTVSLQIVFEQQTRIAYEYDFGDLWNHDIYLEDVFLTRDQLAVPVCLAGRNACPPENCGGPYGYEDMLAALRHPHHEKHDHWMRSTGGGFDPTRFDLVEANVALQCRALVH